MPQDREHNTPGLGALSQDVQANCEAGRGAIAVLKKTFEQWIIIGRAVKDLRAVADRDGRRKTFQRLLDREGFGNDANGKPILGGAAVISRLLQIMDHLPEVVAWHEALPSHRKIEWASPTSVLRHCPAFQNATRAGAAITIGVDLKTERDQLQAKVERLERDGGNLFTPATPARDIVNLLFETLPEPKFAEVIKLGFELQVRQNTLTRQAVKTLQDAIKKQILAERG